MQGSITGAQKGVGGGGQKVGRRWARDTAQNGVRARVESTKQPCVPVMAG